VKKRNLGFLDREDIEKKKQCIMIEEIIKDSLGLHFPFLNPPKFYRSYASELCSKRCVGFYGKVFYFLQQNPLRQI